MKKFSERETNKSVAVYCSASDKISESLLNGGENFGKSLAVAGHSLVFGGCNMGLMGRVALGVKKGGGRVVGVVPQIFSKPEQIFSGCDEVIHTRDMRERKAVMQSRADIFVALPGGFGTLDEMVEIITLAIVGNHQKHTIIANLDGFYDPLLKMFESWFENEFAQKKARTHFSVERDWNALLSRMR